MTVSTLFCPEVPDGDLGIAENGSESESRLISFHSSPPDFTDSMAAAKSGCGYYAFANGQRFITPMQYKHTAADNNTIFNHQQVKNHNDSQGQYDFRFQYFDYFAPSTIRGGFQYLDLTRIELKTLITTPIPFLKPKLTYSTRPSNNLVDFHALSDIPNYPVKFLASSFLSSYSYEENRMISESSPFVAARFSRDRFDRHNPHPVIAATLQNKLRFGRLLGKKMHSFLIRDLHIKSRATMISMIYFGLQ